MAAAAFGLAALLTAAGFLVGGTASVLLLVAAVISLLFGVYLEARSGGSWGPDGGFGALGDGGVGDGPGG